MHYRILGHIRLSLLSYFFSCPPSHHPPIFSTPSLHPQHSRPLPPQLPRRLTAPASAPGFLPASPTAQPRFSALRFFQSSEVDEQQSYSGANELLKPGLGRHTAVLLSPRRARRSCHLGPPPPPAGPGPLPASRPRASPFLLSLCRCRHWCGPLQKGAHWPRGQSFTQCIPPLAGLRGNFLIIVTPKTEKPRPDQRGCRSWKPQRQFGGHGDYMTS
ncbi:Atpase Morc2 [Manis pentadactyla]|nr:Atpase Morc2 [Manis pentadactyla]